MEQATRHGYNERRGGARDRSGRSGSTLHDMALDEAQGGVTGKGRRGGHYLAERRERTGEATGEEQAEKKEGIDSRTSNTNEGWRWQGDSLSGEDLG